MVFSVAKGVLVVASGNIDEPVDTEFIGEHTKDVTPSGFLKRHSDHAANG
jgi:hypothetical protein